MPCYDASFGDGATTNNQTEKPLLGHLSRRLPLNEHGLLIALRDGWCSRLSGQGASTGMTEHRLQQLSFELDLAVVHIG